MPSPDKKAGGWGVAVHPRHPRATKFEVWYDWNPQKICPKKHQTSPQEVPMTGCRTGVETRNEEKHNGQVYQIFFSATRFFVEEVGAGPVRGGEWFT